MMIVTCTSCKAEDAYKVKDYLHYLSIKSGISNSEDINENFNNLLKWNIVEDSDINVLEDNLPEAYVYKTIFNLLEDEIDSFKKISNTYDLKSSNNKMNSNTAQVIVDEAVNVINNKIYKQEYEYEYTKDIKDINDDLNIGDLVFDEIDNCYKVVDSIDDGEYKFSDASFEEVFSKLDIADSFEIDFSNAEVIPYGDEENSCYINNRFNLLASSNHVFSYKGFRISYTINSSSLDVHVSKKADKINIFADASINNIKPSFKWTYEKGDIKNCYFNVKLNTTTELGASFGKYGNYYVKLKDLDSSSFLKSISSMIVPKNDEVEATIPICTIKTPIPGVPLAYVNLTIGIKLYVSGKAEIVLYNAHNIGFEVKNGNPRFFYEHDDDIDTIASASCKAAVAVNLGLDATSFRLCDIELDGGLKAELKTTLHLYDSDFNETEIETDIAYSTLEEVSKDNVNVKVCGDISLYWLLDAICNTSKSILYKYGLTKTYHISNESNQVFGNLHHIEDGKFVKKCTRKSKPVIKNKELGINSANKILLNTYAEVLNVGQTFNIEILGLPQGYSINNIKYSSSDNSIATVTNGIINTIKPGSAKINVHTSDNKYNSYINVLVSTG